MHVPDQLPISSLVFPRRPREKSTEIAAIRSDNDFEDPEVHEKMFYSLSGKSSYPFWKVTEYSISTLDYLGLDYDFFENEVSSAER